MFEKEIRNYLKDSTDYYDPREPLTERKVLQMCMDCAELGYNKAKEEGKVVVEHFEAYGQCRDSRRIASLEKENEELNGKLKNLESVAKVRLANWQKYEEENKELKELVEKYRQAVDKCLHITFMGGGCEVNTIGQYATLVDGYLTDVEGLAKWKN